MANNLWYTKFLSIGVLVLFLMLFVSYNQEIKEYASLYGTKSWPLSESTDNRSPQVKKYEDILCKLDYARISELKNLNSIDDANFLDMFHQFIQNPMSSVCKVMTKFGGSYSKKCKYTDGGKFVCMDDLQLDIQNKECLIYSFGIDKDWTFEDVMGEFGCKVFAHDPTVDYPRKRSENVYFEKIGLASKEDKENHLKDLSSILSANGHNNTKISYLKMDIEEYEIEGLPAWLKSGALDNVDQIALEFHLNHGDVVKKTRTFAKALLDLYTQANFYLIAYEANNCYKNLDKHQKYFSLAEIVLKKRGREYPCGD